MRPKPVTPCIRFSNNDLVRRALMLTLRASFPEGCDRCHRKRGTFRFLGGRPRLCGVKPESLHFARNPLKTRPKFFSQLCRSFPPFGAQWSHDRQLEIGEQTTTAPPPLLATGYWLLASGCSMAPAFPLPAVLLPIGYWLLATGLLASGCSMAPVFPLPAVLLPIGYWLLPTGYWLLPIGYWLH